MSIFAPQAYTKETLAKAFEWLQHQPQSVQQAASNPDMLVSIYTQAQRQGLQKIDIDAPVSSRKFIDDLKTLSRDFAQFEDSSSTSTTTSTMASTAKQTLQQVAPSPQQKVYEAPAQQMNSSSVSSQSSQYQHQQSTSQKVSQQVILERSIHQQTITGEGFFTLDDKSLAIIKNLQERFNLSSPQEALRLVISVGLERISHWN